MVQVLEEFYENLQSVGVSAATGEGMEEFFQKVQACRAEYEQQYLPELQRRQQVRNITVQSLQTPHPSYTIQKGAPETRLEAKCVPHTLQSRQTPHLLVTLTKDAVDT